MRAALLTRRWFGFTALVLTFVAAFILLGRWQLHRGEARHERNALIETNMHRAPAPADQVLSTAHGVRARDQWRRVEAVGHYDPANVLVVRNRTLDGAPGFEILTPLVTADGTGVLVDRGWVPVEGSSADRPEVPPVPVGQVTVVGRLQPSEPPHRGAAPPPGQLAAIDVPGIGRSLPYPLYNGYLELTRQTPASGSSLTPLPAPDLSSGPHYFYAGQWWTFALIAVVGYVVLARREIADAAAAREAPPGRGAANGSPFELRSS